MFKKIFMTFVLVLSSQPGWAQKKKPVSVSYENLVRCFPELQNEDLSFKVDLNKLKEVADEKFVTAQSQLRQRKVRYLDADNNSMILTLTTTVHGLKAETELALQSVDEKGVITDNSLTKNQRINPKQDIINSFLLNATVKSDEYSYNDTKLNGVKAFYRRDFKEIVEYDLDEKAGNRSVNCEKQKDLGIICTCTKK